MTQDNTRKPSQKHPPETGSSIIRIALPVPIHRYFDYLPPSDTNTAITAGQRVLVPFGHRKLIGVVIDTNAISDIAPSKLKAIHSMLDTNPAISAGVIRMAIWASRYYGFPIGECILSCLPPPLRKGKSSANAYIQQWSLRQTTEDMPTPRGTKQRSLLTLLAASPKGQNEPFLKSLGYTLKQLSTLENKKYLQCSRISLTAGIKSTSPRYITKPTLTEEQSLATTQVGQHLGSFASYLLQGVTGSGKTEVYLEIIEQALQQQKQALVLIPEINLSPQTLKRFQARFPQELIMCHHSALSDREKLIAWETVKTGQANILIGTRSAIFYPFASLGCIIVDEEHDSSFKQQEGFRYSARDLAVYRAQGESCPIVLGSATPSLESLHNAQQGKYQKIELTVRPGKAVLPEVDFVDIKTRPLQGGLSQPVLDRIAHHLSQGQQAMVFLNRRGFSPSYGCYGCGWHGECPNCDTRLTFHKKNRTLRCHHCDFSQRLPTQCPNCQSPELHPFGVGTERTEEYLTERFPETRIIRIDRDTTTRKDAMNNIYQRIQSGLPCIIVGTQMLAKGHHFPNITLVVVVSADDGLFSADFRAEENFAQLLIQVAGRAGRAEKKGEVLIQTREGSHPLFKFIKQLNYPQLAQQLLNERQLMQLPPYSYFATIRAEADLEQDAHTFLAQLKEQLIPWAASTSTISGPYPSLIARKANRYRSQLLIHCNRRSERQKLVDEAVSLMHSIKKKTSIRLHLDVDPIEIG